eukprot:m.18328 g.18328  ORF g.18328 m.18328 type:complete len:89 (-) comp11815_c0_seq1:69-335(-)
MAGSIPLPLSAYFYSLQPAHMASKTPARHLFTFSPKQMSHLTPKTPTPNEFNSFKRECPSHATVLQLEVVVFAVCPFFCLLRPFVRRT